MQIVQYLNQKQKKKNVEGTKSIFENESDIKKTVISPLAMKYLNVVIVLRLGDISEYIEMVLSPTRIIFQIFIGYQIFLDFTTVISATFRSGFISVSINSLANHVMCPKYTNNMLVSQKAYRLILIQHSEYSDSLNVSLYLIY